MLAPVFYPNLNPPILEWEDLDWDKRPEQALLGLRKELGLFANLRPAFLFNELASASPIKEEIINDLDILIVRELTC